MYGKLFQRYLEHFTNHILINEYFLKFYFENLALNVLENGTKMPFTIDILLDSMVTIYSLFTIKLL
jgi:hypothetical protein